MCGPSTKTSELIKVTLNKSFKLDKMAQGKEMYSVFPLKPDKIKIPAINSRRSHNWKRIVDVAIGT